MKKDFLKFVSLFFLLFTTSLWSQEAPANWVREHHSIQSPQANSIAIYSDSTILISVGGKILRVNNIYGKVDTLINKGTNKISVDKKGTICFTHKKQSTNPNIPNRQSLRLGTINSNGDLEVKDSIPLNLKIADFYSENKCNKYLPDEVTKVKKDIVINDLLYAGEDERIWVATREHGLLFYDKNIIGFSAWSSVPQHFFYAPNSCKSQKSYRLYNLLKSNSVNQIIKDNHNRIWAATDNGLIILEEGEEENWKAVHFLAGNTVSCLAIRDNSVWILANSYVNPNINILFNAKTKKDILDYRAKTFIDFKVEGEHRNTDLNTLTIDKLNDLWIAGKIIVRYKDIGDARNLKKLPKPTIFNKDIGLKGGLAIDMIADNNGFIWIANRGLSYIKKVPALVFKNREGIRCHDETNGKFVVELLEGIPPITLSYTSSKNPKPQYIRNFKVKSFINIEADTFTFIVTDKNFDSDTIVYDSLFNPNALNGEISYTKPTYEKSTDGTARVEYMSGGQVDRSRKYPDLNNYKFNWDYPNRRKEEKYRSISEVLGTVEFSVTVMDNVGCEKVFSDEIIEPEYYYKSLKENTLLKGDKLDLKINFEPCSDILDEKYSSRGNEIIEYLRNNPSIQISIEGHTEYLAKGESFNCSGYDAKMLSQRRANSVKDFIISKDRLLSNRIKTKGFGNSDPLYENVNYNNLNRRVEIRIQ